MSEQRVAPLISVVMATYQRRNVLIGTLPTVFDQDFPADQFEVIVIVDGSTDGTSELLSGLKPDCPFRFVDQPNSGPSVARQAALNLARGEIVFFTDDDIRFTRGVLKHHLEVHRESRTPVMVRGPIFVAPDSPATLATEATRLWYEEHARNFDPVVNGVQIREDFSIFANTSVPRKSIEHCGGFDISVPFPQEGFELLYRLLKSGLPLRSAPEAITYEVFSKPTRKLITMDARGLGRADWILCQKHPDYRPYSVFANLGRGGRVKRTFRRAFTLAAGIPNLLLDVAIFAADRMLSWTALRQIGIRALGYRYRSEMLRSGLAQAGSWKQIEESFGKRLPVLMYHHVGPRNRYTHYSLTIEPKQFASQIRWLAQNGYSPISPADWHSWKTHGTALPEKPILITFDDAYSDTFQYALPILAQYEFRATVFVVSGMLGQKDAWNEVEGGRSVLTLVSRQQIQEWLTRGMEMGGHGRTHADLTQLDPAGMQLEIVGGKDEVKNLTGSEPFSFAYPFGSYDDNSEHLVRQTYRMAFSVIPGLNTLETDLHLLKRLMVDPRNSLSQFGRMVRTGHLFTPSVIGRLKRKLYRSHSN